MSKTTADPAATPAGPVYTFPRKPPCPRCGGRHTVRDSDYRDTQYRICLDCPKRRNRFAVKAVSFT